MVKVKLKHILVFVWWSQKNEAEDINNGIGYIFHWCFYFFFFLLSWGYVLWVLVRLGSGNTMNIGLGCLKWVEQDPEKEVVIDSQMVKYARNSANLTVWELLGAMIWMFVSPEIHTLNSMLWC